MSYYDKIEIPTEDIDKIEHSMRFVRDNLRKSVFDTLAIKQFRIKCEIDDHEITVYPTNEKPNYDSIEKDVRSKFNLDDWFPFRRSIYQTNEGWIILNERPIGKDLEEFMKNALKCKEIGHLSIKDRKHFVDCFILLLKNNIWSCLESDCENWKKDYIFDYSEDRINYNRWADRYLYLKEDTQGNPNIANYILLDQRDQLLLYKNKNDSI
jgi:hypothetical protein